MGASNCPQLHFNKRCTEAVSIESCEHRILQAPNPASIESCKHRILQAPNPASTESCKHRILQAPNPARTESCTHRILQAPNLHAPNPASTESCIHRILQALILQALNPSSTEIIEFRTSHIPGNLVHPAGIPASAEPGFHPKPKRQVQQPFSDVSGSIPNIHPPSGARRRGYMYAIAEQGNVCPRAQPVPPFNYQHPGPKPERTTGRESTPDTAGTLHNCAEHPDPRW